uniref:Uncharacterized protein n=1 Tax=Cyanoderma ruficeps TaxID=181631 RepID=A0A8C3XBP0_9PASS
MVAAKSFLSPLSCLGAVDTTASPGAGQGFPSRNSGGVDTSPCVSAEGLGKIRRLLDCPGTGTGVHSQVPSHLSTPHDQVGTASLSPYHLSPGPHHQPKRC